MGSHDTFLLAGHRGASADAPENTLAAFRLAWDQGADAVECDIRLSRDGRLMVMHDPSTARTCGRDLVISQSDAADLRLLDAGSSRSGTFAAEPIPFLEEVLNTRPAGGRVLVELKCGVEALPVLAGMLPPDAPDWVTFIGFDGTVMAETRRRFPDHRVFWLCEFPRRMSLNGAMNDCDELLTQAVRLGFTGVDVKYGSLTGDRVRRTHDLGLACYAWTVNDAAVARRLLDWGIDGIATDRPGWLRERLSRP